MPMMNLHKRLMKQILAAAEAWMDEECEGIQISLPPHNGSDEDWGELLLWNDPPPPPTTIKETTHDRHTQHNH